MKTILFSLLFISIAPFAVEWPGTGDCAGTLQACIDAQPDPGIISVATSSTIPGGIFHITKNLKLHAKITFHPIFNNAEIQINPNDDTTITFQGFNLTGSSFLSGSANSGATINVLSNNWSLPDATDNLKEGILLQASPSVGKSSTINIKGNNIIGAGSNNIEGFIDVSSYNDGLSIFNIIDNHVTVLDVKPINGFSPAIYAHKVQKGTIDVQIYANVVRGGTSQIYFNNGNFATTGIMNIAIVSNLLTGVIDNDNVLSSSVSHSAIGAHFANGGLSAIIANNTIDGVKRSVGSDGMGFDFTNLTTTTSTALSIFNNIVVNTAQAYVGPALGTATSVSSSGNNFFWNHGTNLGLTLIASDLTLDPKFIQEGVNYALKDSSPAIDIADTTGTALLEYGFAWLVNAPQIDADGLRRFKGVMTDAGAYEWGDRHVFVQAIAPISNNIPTNDSILDNDANGLPIITQVWNYQGLPDVYNDHPVGIYRSAAKWRLFNEDQINMPDNAKFHVFHPYGNDSDVSNNLFNWSNSSGVNTGFELNAIGLDDSPNKVIFAGQFWDGTYNPSSIEVGYKSSSNAWYLGNVNGTNMPVGSKYMTYSQDKSRNAYLHFVTVDNSANNETVLDHPLLNNNPCALPTVTQQTSYFLGPLFEQNPHNIGVFYSANRWRIFNQDFSNIDIDIGGGPVSGGIFNVMVDPQQVYQCNDIIFKNGFD